MTTWVRASSGVIALLIVCGPASGQTPRDSTRPGHAATQQNDALAARGAEASALMNAGRYGEAAVIYGELASAAPADAGLLMNLGMARYMAGHAAAALAPLQKAVQ